MALQFNPGKSAAGFGPSNTSSLGCQRLADEHNRGIKHLGCPRKTVNGPLPHV
eukprot:CAMPEP_0174358376 /NCGR_PEP_ID=MMETSP0811_2-20130205/42290_1 /TAXON_ID=73025 ORGANISM="Eutreptiella gymnastica-like, Strain CCMP1594" /NCGR_SAMPLE_ID=MMETSP0811_2 /ASSEMBLY_ACC=CAM_ASM_000667 /LENGTH=52 /DNA_ID=CAMNT_0015492095 /DNA_START=51 /DNA_END=209 /DNA_ORIENTATION=-